MSAVGEIEEFQASTLRALASPQRLRIIHLLGSRPREVNQLAADLGMSQAATSQHLASMRAVGLVEPLRDGRAIRYRLSDPDILVACSLMRSVLVRRLTRLGRLAAVARLATPSAAAREEHHISRRGRTPMNEVSHR
jgi:DNA-binding transcriptional ArsR family regulator